jgi:YD repeat-containing protein
MSRRPESIITDKNGNRLTFSYTDGKLTLVEDDSGMALILNYTGNRVSSVVDPLGRQISYEYDGEGNLVKVTDAMANSSLYSYFAGRKLKDIVDREGITLQHPILSGYTILNMAITSLMLPMQEDIGH